MIRPDCELILIFRKTVEGTVAENVLKWGTGVVNIDECRVETEENTHRVIKVPRFKGTHYAGGNIYDPREDGKYESGGNPKGRFPANLVHDGSQEVLELFPRNTKSTGGFTVGSTGKFGKHGTYGLAKGNIEERDSTGFGDFGSVARFFTCIKDKKDKDEVEIMDYEDSLVKLICGDCVEVMKGFDENSIDAIITDPPYGLEFMGKEFDTFKGKGVDPAFCHWFAGFTDGEGCFSVHKKNDTTLDCQFSIQLRADDRPILERIQRELGIGTLRPAKDGFFARYCVSSKSECLVLRDIFRMFPLRAKKAIDFEIWSKALDKWINHKTGEWEEMELERNKLMANRKYKPEGVRVNPYQLWNMRWAVEALRVVKPGGYLLAFGGTRTFHRLACAIEDAGFEFRDTIMWVYGSGFPKSLDVGKVIQKNVEEQLRMQGVIGEIEWK